MSDNYSLINMEGISEVAKELLLKISSAIGWMATRETPERIAVHTYIEEIKQSEYDPITKAALISNAKKSVKEYSNQRVIIQHAIENMKNTSEPKKIDDDWIAQFMDKSRLVSDSDFQLIWGRILAEECNNPGNVPKGLLHILEQMDKHDAERFSLLCTFSVYVTEGDREYYMPVVPNDSFHSYYVEKGLNYDALIDLQALGLIEMSMGGLAPEYSVQFSEVPIRACYFDKYYELSEETAEVYCGNVIYTKTGQALCSAITVEEQEGFFERICIPYWKDIQKKQEDNSFR